MKSSSRKTRVMKGIAAGDSERQAMLLRVHDSEIINDS